ncbi:MAG TPA: ABC transporter permease [Planctomycetota bacterium]
MNNGGWIARFFKLREQPSLLTRFVAGVLCVALVLGVWSFLTAGKPEERILPRGVIDSPRETFSTFGSLWFDRELTRNMALSVWRLLQGFGLAALVGVPLGVLCGTWPRINAFFAPISVFGRNVPVSALVPLTLVWFGIGELQKIMFIFIACVMFIVFDSARAIASVREQYVQTALTLGAKKSQVVLKVLVPLALPDIVGSLRLLFGLAFGYIILAELIGQEGGVGNLISDSQRIGPREHVYLILFTITIVAYGIDRLLFKFQHFIFPYREMED